MLNPKYRYRKISQKLSFEIRDHSIFLLERISSARIMRMLSTNRSRGLPASSPPPEEKLDSNHLTTGLDAQISIQKVGTQKAWDAAGFRWRSMRRSHATETMQPMRASFGFISSKIQEASIRDLDTDSEYSSCRLYVFSVNVLVFQPFIPTTLNEVSQNVSG